MRKNYEPETKKQIVRLHLEQGRTIKSLSEEYGVSTASVSNWVNQFRKECQNNSQAKEEYDSMQEILKLRKELAEARKENEFLKNENQQADYGIFCEGDRLEAYRFIQSYHEIFGTRWLLRKFNICPNAYYNYLKDRKQSYYRQKQETLAQIKSIYHAHNGVDGYRSMRVFLERKKIHLSANTVHKYMNGELQLFSVVRRKKPGYQKHNPHKVFPNLIRQDFSAPDANQRWCTDFTYLFLKDGSVRYNCAILDLHDRSIISSITDKEITSDLAIRTLKKALPSQPKIKGELILHSDQGSQYTSHAFTSYCESVGVTQSMSKAGYPYDNAPMERYYNTLKNELIYQHEYKTDEELNAAIEEYAYTWYNHVRPHSYNGYKTPFEARYSK